MYLGLRRLKATFRSPPIPKLFRDLLWVRGYRNIQQEIQRIRREAARGLRDTRRDETLPHPRFADGTGL